MKYEVVVSNVRREFTYRTLRDSGFGLRTPRRLERVSIEKM